MDSVRFVRFVRSIATMEDKGADGLDRFACWFGFPPD